MATNNSNKKYSIEVTVTEFDVVGGWERISTEYKLEYMGIKFILEGSFTSEEQLIEHIKAVAACL